MKGNTMASVNIRVHSDNPFEFQRQIDSIKSLADALENYAGTTLSGEDTHEQARIALMHAAMRAMSEIHALSENSIF
jgi:hypothetical protein